MHFLAIARKVILAVFLSLYCVSVAYAHGLTTEGMALLFAPVIAGSLLFIIASVVIFTNKSSKRWYLGPVFFFAFQLIWIPFLQLVFD